MVTRNANIFPARASHPAYSTEAGFSESVSFTPCRGFTLRVSLKRPRRLSVKSIASKRALYRDRWQLVLDCRDSNGVQVIVSSTVQRLPLSVMRKVAHDAVAISTDVRDDTTDTLRQWGKDTHKRLVHLRKEHQAKARARAEREHTKREADCTKRRADVVRFLTEAAGSDTTGARVTVEPLEGTQRDILAEWVPGAAGRRLCDHTRGALAGDRSGPVGSHWLTFNEIQDVLMSAGGMADRFGRVVSFTTSPAAGSKDGGCIYRVTWADGGAE